MLSFLALASFVGTLERAGDLPRRRRWTLRAAVALPLVLPWAGRSTSWTLGVLGVLAVLGLAARGVRGRPGGPAVALVARGVAVAALLLWARQHFGLLWQGLDALAAGVSSLAGLASGRLLDLGPSASAVWVGLLFAAALPGRGWRMPSTGPRRAGAHLAPLASITAVVSAVAIALPGAEKLAGALFVSLLRPPLHHPAEPPAAGVLQGALSSLLALLLLSLLAGAWLGRRSLAVGETPRPVLRRLAAASALALVVLAGVLDHQGAEEARPRPVVAFRDQGLVDWERPAAGRYGLGTVGMFGALLAYLDAWGFSTVTRGDPLTPASLAGVAALVVVNPTEPFSDDELRAVWDHVRAGGGLLVLGDHTDLLGSQAPLDQLLRPAGIRFEFTSALPLREGWLACQEWLRHPLTAGLATAWESGIGVGASLRLGNRGARPLIVGRYAWSDLGNRANVGPGAFLGDYRYQAGERLGDVVLAATAEVGRGRVVVFGDTSTFQTLALPATLPLVVRTFQHLTAEPRRPPPVAWRSLWVGLASLAAAAFLWACRHSPSRMPDLAVLVLAGAALGLLAERGNDRRFLASCCRGADLAVVDAGHVERIERGPFGERAAGGLLATLLRGGDLPWMRREARAADLEKALLVAYVTPARRPARSELRALDRLLGRGGTVLVAASWPDREAAGPLFAVAGLRLGPQPLGSLEVAEGEHRLRFVDAWPLVADGSRQVVSRARWQGHTVVAESRVGPGRVLAFGDGRFLNNENLEGESRFHAGNLRFLEELLSAGGRR